MPASPAPTASAAVQGGLTGRVSSLTGAVSGLRTRTSEMGTIVELPSDALFAFDSDRLSPAAEDVLRKALGAIRQAPPGTIGIVGHTDSKGDDDYNRTLSERRAQAVADWLAQEPGIRQRERRVEGRGEAEPVAPNARPDGSDDEAGRARNRRVELVLPNAA